MRSERIYLETKNRIKPCETNHNCKGLKCSDCNFREKNNNA